MSRFRRICIVGPGAIGGTVAVRLARAGYEISTLARPPRAARIAQRGITLITEGSTFHAHPRAASTGAELGPHDLVVITSKANHLIDIAPQLGALCSQDTPLVFLMNGVPWWFFEKFPGPYQGTKLSLLDRGGILGRTIDVSRVVWGVIEIAARETPDGAVEHYQANRVVLGRPDDTTTDLEDIGAVFRAGGLVVRTTQRIRETIWTKLEGNTSVSPVSALALANGTAMLTDPLLRDLVLGIVAETRAVGAALGLEPDAFLGDMAQRYREMRPPASDFKPSMLQDIERGRPIELDALVGIVVEIADLIGVEVPRTKTVFGLLRARLKAMGLYAPP
jgi:2-dehydropantoate 2-reductase